MSTLGGFSGCAVVSILEKHFGFIVVGSKGSHIKLRRFVVSSKITVIVPNHKELAPGTLRSIIRQSGITVKEFITHISI